MSTRTKADQFDKQIREFFSQEPEKFLGAGLSFSDYDGPDLSETISCLHFIRSTIIQISSAGRLPGVPWSCIKSMQAKMAEISASYVNLRNAKDQGNFQQFAVHVDALAHQIRSYGLPIFAMGGAQVEELSVRVSAELQRLETNNAELESLKNDVRTLITPAVAGSLSQSFTTRRDALSKERKMWFVLCVVLGGITIYMTYDFAAAIEESLRVAGNKENKGSVPLWPIIAIRSIVLLPLFAAFGFTFSQYRKERDFEEEYAHKAAVAASLPNYGDLAREQGVRDKIVTGATSVIFSSPTAHARESEKSEAIAHGLREGIEAVGKAISSRSK